MILDETKICQQEKGKRTITGTIQHDRQYEKQSGKFEIYNMVQRPRIDRYNLDIQRSGSKRSSFPTLFSSVQGEGHRGIMTGVSEEMILGNKITKIHQSYAQRLICQRKEAQNKYIKELESKSIIITYFEKYKTSNPIRES